MVYVTLGEVWFYLLDIRKSKCITHINVTSGKFASGVNDTGGRCQLHTTQLQIAPGINDSSSKFAAGVSDIGHKSFEFGTI